MKVFTIIAIIFLVITLPVFSGGQKEESPKMEGAMMAPADDMKADTMGPFIEFKDSAHAMMLAETKPTVLFFNASWCPTCKAAREDFNANASELMGINLVLVDYDHSADLQKKYGVTYQHTFVQIAPDGESLVKWNGGGANELLDNIIIKDM